MIELEIIYYMEAISRSVMNKLMKQINSYQFKQVYEWLGINLSDLGCIMLDLEPLPTPKYFCQDGVTAYECGLSLYHTIDKSKFWINGYVGLKTAHITLLYGLMQSGLNFKQHVDAVLEGCTLNEVEIDHFGYFESPYPEEPYYCIVAHIKPTPELIEAHERLELLPHINTFAGYKPHSTIAYIIKNEEMRDWFIRDLNEAFAGKKMRVTGVNYGGKKI